jgi:hypothetical protein
MPRQPIFIVSRDSVIQHIVVQSFKYKGLEFGGKGPEEIIEEINRIKIKLCDDLIDVTKVCQVLQSGRTGAMIGNANKGLKNVEENVKKDRIRIDEIR